MGNHYHLIIETAEGNLSRAMHYINSSYTTYSNIKRKRSGHLFQGRFKAILVDKDSYLLELSRYVHLNPVRAKMAAMPADYPYSSYGCLSSFSVCIEHRQCFRIMIQQDESTADSTAWQQVAAFVLLECPRATADQDTCRFLGEMKFFTDATNFLRLKQSFASSLEEVQHPVGSLHIFTGMDTFL